VGNGNVEVGSRTPTRKTGRASVERWLGSNNLPEVGIDERILAGTDRAQVSGAMTEQRGDSGRGDQSAPQKLVRLVGCRETKERP
jgi:hypothetical protein